MSINSSIPTNLNHHNDINDIDINEDGVNEGDENDEENNDTQVLEDDNDDEYNSDDDDDPSDILYAYRGELDERVRMEVTWVILAEGITRIYEYVY